MHQNTIPRPLRFLLFLLLLLTLLAVLSFTGFRLYQRATEPEAVAALRQLDLPDWIDVALIAVDGAARRGVSLEEVGGIVIHYVGNPGTSAEANRNYYNNPGTEVSSHFLVGLEGEVIQCVPLHEKSSASNFRNRDTISIEVCHPDETGKFSDVTYASLVKLTAWLCDSCGFTEEQIIRHYDVTGKACPLYFVEHEDAWEAFKADVAAARTRNLKGE